MAAKKHFDAQALLDDIVEEDVQETILLQPNPDALWRIARILDQTMAAKGARYDEREPFDAAGYALQALSIGSGMQAQPRAQQPQLRTGQQHAAGDEAYLGVVSAQPELDARAIATLITSPTDRILLGAISSAATADPAQGTAPLKQPSHADTYLPPSIPSTLAAQHLVSRHPLLVQAPGYVVDYDTLLDTLRADLVLQAQPALANANGERATLGTESLRRFPELTWIAMGLRKQEPINKEMLHSALDQALGKDKPSYVRAIFAADLFSDAPSILDSLDVATARKELSAELKDLEAQQPNYRTLLQRVVEGLFAAQYPNGDAITFRQATEKDYQDAGAVFRVKGGVRDDKCRAFIGVTFQKPKNGCNCGGVYKFMVPKGNDHECLKLSNLEVQVSVERTQFLEEHMPLAKQLTYQGYLNACLMIGEELDAHAAEQFEAAKRAVENDTDLTDLSGRILLLKRYASRLDEIGRKQQ